MPKLTMRLTTRSKILKPWYWMYVVITTCFSLLLAGSNAIPDAAAGSPNEENLWWRKVSKHYFELSSCLFSNDSQAHDHLNNFCDHRQNADGTVRLAGKRHNTFQVTEYICDQSEGKQNCKNVSLFFLKADIVVNGLCISSSIADLKQEVIGLQSALYIQYLPICVKSQSSSQVQQQNQERKIFSCYYYL